MGRYRAPRQDREILAQPGFSKLPGLVHHNRQLLNRSIPILGRDLREVRRELRTTFLRCPDDVPVIMTGHQPEIFHPGVWAKDFATYGLAQRMHGWSFHLVVDNDTMKSRSIRIPGWDEWTPESVHARTVALDRFPGEVPFELARVEDPQQWRKAWEEVKAFKERLNPTINRLYYLYFYRMEQRSSSWSQINTWIHDSAEKIWSVENELFYVSELCQTAAWRWFVVSLLQDLPRFAAVYNRALQSYRKENRLRSKSHPAPDLAEQNGWLEAPFWSWSTEEPRRQGVYLHRNRESVRIAGQEFPWKGNLDFLAENDLSVRPRALTLTLFVRLFLADFFLHGIGGGKYDEVTDNLFRDYFEIEPPAFQVLSATLHLPLPRFPASPADVREWRRKERDLEWNPQRYLPGDTPLLQERERLLSHEGATKRERRQRFFELRRIRDQLERGVESQRRQVAEQRMLAEKQAAANAILQRRDYPWILYPEEMLKEFMLSIVEMAAKT